MYKNCAYRNLTFPKNSHQTAKNIYENFEISTSFSFTSVFWLQQ
jgi:hypothetical protein